MPEIVESGPYHGALSLAWSVRPGSGGSDSTYYQLFDAGSGAALTDALLVSDTAYAEILSLASQDDGPTVVFNKPSGIEKSVINHVQQSPYTVTENADVSTVILDVNATDAENDTLQFSVSGTDTSLVTIDADSGEVRLKASADYETKSSYSFTVNVSDGELTDGQDVTIEVTDVVENQAPTVTGVVISGAESDGSTPKSGTLVAGDKILVTVTVDENITVDTSGGTPQYTIDVGGVSKTAGYVSGSGGTSLVFAYEVQAGDLDDAGGITSDTSALDANSGTLQDSDGHDLDLTTIVVSAGANTVGVDAESKFSAIKISGSVAGDRFGRWISTAGDFDGDGVLDVAVSASALTEAGSSFVLSGAAINSLGSETHHEIDLSSFSPNQYVQIDGIDAEDHSGHRIVHAGDLNGDGFDDITISAIRAEDPARSQNHGEVYVVWGSSDSFEPTIINLAGLNGTNGVRIIGLDGWSGTGLDLRAAGDVDGDGTPDILIGSEGLGNPSALTESDSYLVYGDALLDTGATFDLSSLDGSNGIRLFGADDGDRSGISVAGGGDVDGDDLSDVLIGAFWAEDATGSTNEGETYLVYGSHLKELRSQQVSSINLGSLGSSEGVRIHGRDEEDGSGHSVDFIGDIDGDGKSEVLVGAHLAEDGDKQTQGESYLVFGSYLNDQVATFDLGSLDGTNGVRLKGANAGDESAYHVASAGDVDNDGKGDFLVGARHADNGTKLDAGITYVVFGDSLLSGNATFDLGSINGTTGVAILGIDAGDHAGISVNSAGDLDGDGFDDALIGVDYANPSGEFYVLSGYSLNQAAEGLGVATSGVIDLAVDFGWGSGSSNSSPTFGSATTSTSVPENTSGAFYTAEATDADSDSLTYSVVGGADGDKFEFNGTGLTFKAAPDSENPTDSDTDNVYEVQIQADDGNGGTATQTVSVAVSDVVDHVAVFAGSGAYGDQKSVRSWDVNGNGFSDLHVRPISGETSNYKFIIRDDQIHFDGKVRIISDASDYSIYGSVNSDRWSNSRFGSPDINADGLADLLYTSTVGSELVGKIQDESNFLTGFDLDLDAQVSSQTFKVSGFSGVVALAASVGDLDGDSRHEIIIVDNDYLYLIEGNSLEAALGQNVSISDLLDDGTGGSRASYSTPNHGSAAAGIGDRNNDGVVDFLVGQPYGSIDIISAAEFLTDDEDVTIHNSTSVMTLSSYVPFGYTAEAMPDVDNDGISELLISAGRSGHTSGSVFVVFGSHINDNFSTDLDLDSLDGSDGVKITGTHNSWFGHSSTFIDDLDSDGIPELVVSSPEGSSQEYGEGAVYVIYGDSLIGTDGHLNLTDILSSSVGIIEGSDSGNMFGHNMDVVGDLTGDGLGEIAIGGETVDLGYSGGGIYVIPSELIPGPGETLNMSSFSFEII